MAAPRATRRSSSFDSKQQQRQHRNRPARRPSRPPPVVVFLATKNSGLSRTTSKKRLEVLLSATRPSRAAPRSHGWLDGGASNRGGDTSPAMAIPPAWRWRPAGEGWQEEHADGDREDPVGVTRTLRLDASGNSHPTAHGRADDQARRDYDAAHRSHVALASGAIHRGQRAEHHKNHPRDRPDGRIGGDLASTSAIPQPGPRRRLRPPGRPGASRRCRTRW